MVSFLHKFTAAANQQGIEVTQNLNDDSISAILVIGSSREFPLMKRLQSQGVNVVQRLDGINWIHRKKPISLAHSIRAEYGNLMLSFMRRFITNKIIYQSAFSKTWWNNWYGSINKPNAIIHNAVDLTVYSPQGVETPPSDVFRLLVVEGSLGGGYESGLTNAVHLAEAVAQTATRPVELMVVGEVHPALKAEWQARSQVPIRWEGLIKREQVPALLRSAHALFSADLHPACPNSVIEALACGLPVVSYDTGSLAELVPDTAGCIAPYGADSWKLHPPIVAPLALGTRTVLENQAKFRAGARAHAEQAFNIETMFQNYLPVLLEN